MRRLQIAALVALPWLTACAPPDFPEDTVFADSGALTIPALQPLEDLVPADAPDDADATAALQVRGDRLRARADTLRRSDP